LIHNPGAPTRWWRRFILFSAFRMRRMCLWPNTRVTLSLTDAALSAPPIRIAEVGLGSGCPHSCGLSWISADANRLQTAISTVHSSNLFSIQFIHPYPIEVHHSVKRRTYQACPLYPRIWPWPRRALASMTTIKSHRCMQGVGIQLGGVDLVEPPQDMRSALV